MRRSGGNLLIRLCLLLCLTLPGMLAAGAASAQSLIPIPGLPAQGDAPAPQDAQPPDTGTGAPAATESPTQQLVDILRDDAAREALIRELEAGLAATEAGGAAPPTDAAPADAAPEEATHQTVGAAAVHATREALADLVVWAEGFWARVKRIPSTVQLAFRAFERDVLSEAALDILRVAGFTIAALFLVRLLVLPIRRGLTRRAEGAALLRTMVLRGLATAMDIVTLPVSLMLALFAVALLQGGLAGITSMQSLFINAFFAVEVARALARFVLSPSSPGLRLVPLGETAVLRLWRMAQVVIYLLGYGQLLVVPIVSEEISIFVGRAVSAVLSGIVVGVVIAWVLVRRQDVARWLSGTDEARGLDRLFGYLAERWHWPVLAYLAYLLIVVLTRPGNVLLPLLWSTFQIVATLVGGLVATGILGRVASRRLHVPGAVAGRLPLLEERLNQMVPAALMLIRVGVVLLVVGTILEILGAVDFSGALGSERGVDVTGRLISAGIVVAVIALIWLAISSWVDYRLNPFVGTAPTPREITLLTLMRNAITIALVVIATMLALSEMGMNIGPLIASAGVLGLAISFGAQRMVEDIITGVFIQLENAMNVGDVVDVGGIVGVVEKLTVRSVTLRDLEGVVHMVPFSRASTISNYMRDFAYHLADIGVAYREDLEEVKTAMHDAFDILKTDPDAGGLVLGDLEWFGLNSFGDSALVMRARIKTVPGEQWGVGRHYNAIVKRLFDERGIEIPFPHQTLYFGEDKSGRAPPLHMRIDRRGTPAAPAAHHVAPEAEPHHRAPGTDMPASDDA